MFFDELQLKFNEGKFVSTVRQPDLFAPSSLGTDACERLLQELEPGKCFVFLFESKVSFILSHCWEMKKKRRDVLMFVPVQSRHPLSTRLSSEPFCSVSHCERPHLILSLS